MIRGTIGGKFALGHVKYHTLPAGHLRESRHKRNPSENANFKHNGIELY